MKEKFGAEFDVEFASSLLDNNTDPGVSQKKPPLPNT